MTAVDAPFVCTGCGGSRFVELHQYNDTNCKLQPEPETNPVMIVCWGCRRIYQQTTDWTWGELDAKGTTR